MHWYTDKHLIKMIKIQRYTSTGKKHTPGGAGGTADHNNDGDHRYSHVEVLMGIELFVRRCLEQQKVQIQGPERCSPLDDFQWTTRYCGFKMFKVHTDSGWRARVSPKKLSGKKIWGCWCRIVGCGWRLWQFAKLWSQTMLGILVLKMIGVRKSLSRIAGLLLDVWTSLRFKQLKNWNGGTGFFCWGFLSKIGVWWRLLFVGLSYPLTPTGRFGTFFLSGAPRCQVVPPQGSANCMALCRLQAWWCCNSWPLGAVKSRTCEVLYHAAQAMLQENLEIQWMASCTHLVRDIDTDHRTNVSNCWATGVEVSFAR